MTDIVRISPIIHSWNSCRWAFNLIPFSGIVGCDYEEKRTRKLVYGSNRSGTPLGITSGKYEPGPLNIRMLRDSFAKLTLLLFPLGLGSYGDAEFVFFAQYIEPVPGSTPQTVIATGCYIVGVKDAQQEGTDELVTDVAIQPLAFTRNGQRLWSLIRSVP